MTTRNNYFDSYTRQFAATVVETSKDAGAPFVVLDASYVRLSNIGRTASTIVVGR